MLRAPRFACSGLIFLLWLGSAQRARAADETRVATALEEGNRWDIFFSAAWRYENHLARIKREFEQPGRTENGIELVRDLKYARTRHLLDLRVEFGVLWDVSLFIEAPLVLSDSRLLSFEQDGPCTFPPAANPTCVNQP